MISNESIKFKCKDNKEIEFPSQFGDVCLQAKEAIQGQVIPIDSIDIKTMEIIKKFYEVHNFEEKSVQVNIPLQSEKLKEELDEKSYAIIEPYKGIKNIPQIQPLIDAAYYLNLEGFKNVCLAAISYEFVIGSTEEDLIRFKKAHNVNITPEEEKQYSEEFEQIFREQNEKKKREMEERLQEEQKN